MSVVFMCVNYYIFLQTQAAVSVSPCQNKYINAFLKKTFLSLSHGSHSVRKKREELTVIASGDYIQGQTVAG